MVGPEHSPDFLPRLQDGDRAAFRQLFEAYGEMVYNVCFQIVGNREDAVQDVFLKIHRESRYPVRL